MTIISKKYTTLAAVSLTAILAFWFVELPEGYGAEWCLGLQALNLAGWLGLMVAAINIGSSLWERAAKQEEAVIPEASRAMDTLASIDKALKSELDTGAAKQALGDAEVQARSLVRLVKGLARKAADMREEADNLAGAITAIRRMDPDLLAEAIGAIQDPVIAEALAYRGEDQNYWRGVSSMVHTQKRGLERWSKAYSEHADEIMAEIAAIRQRVPMLRAVADGHILQLTIDSFEGYLLEASDVLQVRPEDIEYDAFRATKKPVLSVIEGETLRLEA